MGRRYAAGDARSGVAYVHLEPAPAPHDARPEVIAKKIPGSGMRGNGTLRATPFGVHCGHGLLAVAVGVVADQGTAGVPAPPRNGGEKSRRRSHHVRAAAIGAADGRRQGFLLQIHHGDGVYEEVPVGVAGRAPWPAAAGLMGIPGQVGV
jgi:hypothetical protein